MISALQFGHATSRAEPCPETWTSFLDAFHNGDVTRMHAWSDLFGSLQSGVVDDLMIVGQIGQSLDGRIATATGHSKFVNCPAGIDHLHRLRALVDVVVVGVGTALADDPQLTVRQVTGPHPVRAVIDPKGRLGHHAKLFRDDGVRRLLITMEGTAVSPPPGVEVVALPAVDGDIAPPAIAAALRRAGLRRILIEGGADTVSRFISARCLDRLHVNVAPVMLGAGGPSIALPPLDRADQAYRMPLRVHRMGDDVLFDCDLSAQRCVLGIAKKSV